LAELFGEILIPEAVRRELLSSATPPKVMAWMSQPPPWLQIEAIVPPFRDEELERLGAGEREAIALAMAHQPDSLLLIDEGRGRKQAALREKLVAECPRLLRRAWVGSIARTPTVEAYCRLARRAALSCAITSGISARFSTA